MNASTPVRSQFRSAAAAKEAGTGLTRGRNAQWSRSAAEYGVSPSAAAVEAACSDTSASNATKKTMIRVWRRWMRITTPGQPDSATGHVAAHRGEGFEQLVTGGQRDGLRAHRDAQRFDQFDL